MIKNPASNWSLHGLVIEKSNFRYFWIISWSADNAIFCYLKITMWETNGRKSSNLVKSHEPICHFIRGYLGAEYLVVVSSRFLKTREKYTNWDNLVCLSFYIFLWFFYIFWGQSHLCLLLQNTFFCKSKHTWLCATVCS